VLFFCTARYRVPIVAPLILLASQASFWCVDAARQTRWRELLGALAVLLPAVALVNVTPEAERLVAEAQSHHTLGSTYQEQGKLELAIESYREALEAYPGYLNAHHDLGAVLMEMGRTNEAIDHFRRALRAKPKLQLSESEETLASVHNNLGAALIKLGQYPLGVEHLRRAIELSPGGAHVQAQYNRGVALAALGRKAEAIEAYQRAVETDPDYAEAHYNLACLLAGQGKLGEAVGHFRATVGLQPGHATALYKLARALSELGRLTEAEPVYQQTVTAIEEQLGLESPHLANCLQDYAKVLRRLGREAEAARVESRAGTIQARQDN
jgi:tetratricopeptide (TPR) repeat protein